MRAISVKVDEVIGVAGFVVPGAKVDVVMTINSQEQPVSRVVVTNVQVLDRRHQVSTRSRRSDGKPVPTTVVTLLVTPEDAEKISLASSVGPITLTLRNPLDVEPTQTKARAWPADGHAGAAAGGRRPRRGRGQRPSAGAGGAAAPPQIYTVETIRAAKRTAEVVR